MSLVRVLVWAALVAAAEATTAVNDARNCCVGMVLKAGLPDEERLPWHQYDATQVGNARWTGFLPEVIDAMQNFTGATIQIVPFDAEGSLEDLADALGNGTIDFGPRRLSEIDFNRVTTVKVEYTTPFFTFSQGVMTRFTTSSPTGWGMFDPFESKLWGAIIGFVPALALTAWLCEAFTVNDRDETDFERSPTGVVGAFYFALGCVISGGTDYGTVRTGPGRVVLTSIFFFFLIFNATYTANLASILTATSTTYLIQNQHDLQAATACDPGVNSHPSVAGYVRRLVEPPDTMISERARVDHCIAQLQANAVDTVIAAAPLLHHTHGPVCQNIGLPAITFGPTSFAFAVTRRTVGSETDFVSRMSGAVVGLQLADQLASINSKHFSSVHNCVQSSSTTVTLQEMTGLFVTAGALAGLGVVLRLGTILWARRRGIRVWPLRKQ
eukprot:TRINITY_DN18994_c0_g1_i1.p1 TRINITY_DN18994_c0_g1~~TRINITY_DN18994_c0_g1_i1.p1  ORF type:complete len:441 (+),score=88.85 TRINITY_DN18994_c0_g1_i1:64-1386(+)